MRKFIKFVFCKWKLEPASLNVANHLAGKKNHTNTPVSGNWAWKRDIFSLYIVMY